MKTRRPVLSSVTRWLSVVVGCTVLEMVQPTMATAPAVNPTSGAEGMILYPRERPDPRPAGGGTGARATWLWAAAVLAVAGAALLWRQRRQAGSPAGQRCLAIDETRALGNRQYLVVASHEGRRFLLGVAPGSIQLLSELARREEDDDDDAAQL